MSPSAGRLHPKPKIADAGMQKRVSLDNWEARRWDGFREVAAGAVSRGVRLRVLKA